MTTLLQINASLNNGNGQSSQLANQFVARVPQAPPWGEDRGARTSAAAEPVPHLNAERFGSFITKPEERSAAQRAVVAYSDILINELRQADVIVLGLPMYNFGVPSQLKAYFDHIARVGETFKYTEKGPVGQLTGKKVYVFAARGGGPCRYADRHTDELMCAISCAFLAMDDVEFVYAEGLAISPESKEAGLASAAAEIERLVA